MPKENVDSKASYKIQPALTLVLGEARSGKTRWAVQKALNFHGIPIMVAPSPAEADQLNRAVLDSSANSSRAVATTFPLLAAELLRSAESGAARMLNTALQRLILADLIKNHIGTDDYFGKMHSAPGFAAALQHSINELKFAGATADQLESLPPDGAKRVPYDQVRRKHDDLIRILRAYEQFLVENRAIDSADYLRSAAARLTSKKSAVPYNASFVVFDGFYRFDAAQIEIIRALAAAESGSTKRRVAITLCYDDARPLLFATPSLTLQRLRNDFITEEIYLPPATNSDSTLDRLSRRLYAVDTSSPTDLAHPAIGNTDQARISSTVTSGIVQILSAPNAYMESEMVAREFVRMRSVRGSLWSDFGIVVRHAADYAETVGAVFERYNIPLSVVSAKKVAYNPLIARILLLLRTYRFGWQRSDVIAFLKSSYVSSGRERADLALILAKRFAIREGRSAWLAHANELCDSEMSELITKMALLESGVCEAGLSVSVRSKRVMDLVSALGLSNKGPLQDSKIAAEENAAFRSASAQLNNLSKLEKLRQTGPSSFADFHDRVIAAWNDAGYHLPHEPESVNLVEPHNTREFRFKTAAVMGLTERMFPRRITQDPFLRDEERHSLSTRGSLELQTHSQRTDEERFLFYLAITSASENLLLSYPRAGLERDMLPSFFLDEARTAAGELISENHTTLDDIVPRMEIASEDREQSLSALAFLFNPIDHQPINVDASDSSHFVAVQRIEHDLRFPVNAEAVQASIRSRHLPKPPRITSDDLIYDFCNRDTIITVDELTAFNRCPFHFTMRFRLGIEPDHREAYNTVKLNIVRQTIATYYTGNRICAVTNVTDLHSQLREIASVILQAASPDAAPMTREILKRAVEGALNAAAKREYACNNRFQMLPAKFGLAFGFGNAHHSQLLLANVAGCSGTAPPLILNSDENDREVRIAGIIDRIDVDRDGKALVLNFTADAGADYGHMVRGESVELPLYMLAAERLFNHTAAVGCTDAFKSSGRRRLVRTQHVALARFAPIQFLEDEAEVRAVTRDNYSQLINTAILTAIRAVQRMENADASPNPSEHCRTCAYGSICRASISGDA